MAADVRVQAGADGALALTGMLTFDTAAAALAAGSRQLAAGELRQLDLGGLEGADSAGLACVLALMAEAVRLGRPLRVRRLPDGLRALARVSDVESLLDSADG